MPARVIPFAVSNINVTTEPIKEQSQTQKRLNRTLILMGQDKTCTNVQGKLLFQETDRLTMTNETCLLSWIQLVLQCLQYVDGPVQSDVCNGI